MRWLLHAPAATALAALSLAGCRPGGAAGDPAPGAPPAGDPLRSEPAGPSGELPRIDASTSLLVVSPHPDDETLCCGGLIQRVAHAGGRVNVVWITSGDGERLALLRPWRILWPRPEEARALGERRMEESRIATALLGVAAAGQLFLGYPDGGLPEVLAQDRTRRYRSPATDATAVPYADALFPAHPYTRESLERDFAAVLERTRPTLILAPSPLDSHPDHRAVGILTMTVSAREGQLAQVRYWFVHGGEGWPSPRELMPGVPLTPAPLSRGLAPLPFALAPAEEDHKLLAIEAYLTQMQRMSPFLLAFVRTTELYFALPTPPAAAAMRAPRSF
jgi:LmbE family N-acetylglucosaminyl deacetylase